VAKAGKGSNTREISRFSILFARWFGSPGLLSLLLLTVLTPLCSPAQSQLAEPLRPEWCRELPRPQYAKLERVKVPDPWFEVYRVGSGVFAIYEPHQFEEVISYLILGSKRALLFDTGTGIGNIHAVVKSLTALPVAVLNSHTHFDHTGGNADFSEIYDEDTPFTRTNEKGQSNVYSRDALAPARICGQLPNGIKPDTYAIRPFQISHRVRDGERIELGGRELEVIFTPGHTPDSLSLLDSSAGLLFTGDTFYLGPIYLFTPETNFAAYTESVARLVPLLPKLKLLLPAHNVPVADPAFLSRLQAAVHKIQRGTAESHPEQGYREYPFDGFSLLLPDK
jgi:glyoxylase-like metal-dependent hydrolase (beta-lactamase superfamily II)